MNINPKLWLLLVMFSGIAQANSIEQRFQKAFVKTDFVEPSPSQLQQLQTTFKQELQNVASADSWKSLGMERQVEAPFVFLTEIANQTQGHGFIALRSDKAKPWLLQSPHSKSDLHTGEIASLLMAEGDFKAAIWSTLPRKTVDLAHITQSYWQIITQAFAEVYPQGRIIQIHGFEVDERKTLAGAKADIIASAGHNSPPVWVQKVTSCLKTQTGLNVLLYPNDISELGATTNSQGQLLQSLGYQGFLHLEMNATLRKNLLKQPELRKKLLSCLEQGE